MNVRSLPNLQPVVDSHEHVALLWDERLEGRAVLAVGAKRSLQVDMGREGCWDAWQAFVQQGQRRKAWSVGWLGYDLYSALEGFKGHVQASPPHPSHWPLLHWIEPEAVLVWEVGEVHPKAAAPGALALALESLLSGTSHTSSERENDEHAPAPRSFHADEWQPLAPLWTKEHYLEKFNKVHRALKRGDLYEMNLCMPWKGAMPGPESWRAFERLAQATRAPHSAYFQAGNHRMLSASPERFVSKKGQIVRSQPIKGTVKRGNNPEEDLALKQGLLVSEKERAENVMIVDLVRNDLSQIAEPRSVEVEELFGIHSFATVHQMISTIRCTLQPHISEHAMMEAMFPMGSMTGAPKISAVKHIASLEEHGRGVYSGAVGYVDPEGDLDFNVVIRTLLHNASTREVHATVGGAITLLSEGDQEYEECLLKAHALRTSLRP